MNKPIQKGPEQIFNIYAQAYNEWIKTINSYNNQIKLFCNTITNTKANILDVACGPANITTYMHSIKPNFNYVGVDLAPEMIKIAKKNCDWGSFSVLSIDNIKALNQKFDGIICGFGLPYINKQAVKQFVIDSFDMLNTNGVLYISTILGTYNNQTTEVSSDGKYKMKMYYYSVDFLESELQKKGFKILSTDVVESINKKNKKVSDVIIIATK